MAGMAEVVFMAEVAEMVDVEDMVKVAHLLEIVETEVGIQERKGTLIPQRQMGPPCCASRVVPTGI